MGKPPSAHDAVVVNDDRIHFGKCSHVSDYDDWVPLGEYDDDADHLNDARDNCGGCLALDRNST